MFTGIIEELGKVVSFERGEAGARLVIGCKEVPETLDRSNLGDLKAGDEVNLERPLPLGARLSGHIVQGHVDATGTLESLRELGDGNLELIVQAPRDLDKYLVYKGSITIDGISLTIASVADACVKVAIIPHTWEATNLHARKAGERVNIECDVLAKHVAKLMSHISAG